MPTSKERQSNAQRQAAYRKRAEQARCEQLSAQSLPPLPAIPTMPGQTRWTGALRQAYWLLTNTIAEMEQYQEERSDQWRESERGEAFASRLELLQDLSLNLEELTE